MNSSLLVVILACVCAKTLAQEPGNGTCPVPPTQEGFTLSPYLGRWYEVQRYEFVFFQLGTKCSQATYSLKENGRMKVENLGYNTESNETVGAIGEAYAPDPKEPGKLLLSFGNGEGPYWVLKTDYVNYTLIYTCAQIEGLEGEFADIVWILSRKRTLPQETIDMLKRHLESVGVRSGPLRAIDQTGCDQ